MIRNSDLLFAKMKDFQDKRNQLVMNHEKKIESLERFKGSKGYDDDMKKEKEAFSKELTALQEKYRPGIMAVLEGMSESIGRRSVSAPTTDQVNLLNVMKMRKNISLEECRRAAEAVKDNPISLKLLSEIAHDHGIMQSFDHLSTEMSSETADKHVENLAEWAEDFLQYDTKRISRVAKAYYDRKYGETTSQLPKWEIFDTKEEFFSQLGLDDKAMNQFVSIVDA